MFVLTILCAVGFLSFPLRCSSTALVPLPQVVRTPEERFANLPNYGYPWPPNYLNLNLPGFPVLRLHYLDLGPANAPETILLLHGVPSWSFLYRKMIPLLLNAGYRVVALDHIGFGRSDKLTNQNDYSHDLHVASVLQLVKFLNLQGVTLFGQDLGGPSGLSVAMRETTRFRRFVLLNTLIPQGDIFSSPLSVLRHLPYLAWRTTNAVLRRSILIGLVFAVSSSVSVNGILGYKAPFPSFIYKAGAAQWPLIVPLFSNEPMAIEMQRVREFLRTQWTGPVLYGYSDRELFTTPGGDLFRQLFQNNGCEVRILDSGHFVQEDQPEQVTSLVINFINRGCS